MNERLYKIIANVALVVALICAIVADRYPETNVFAAAIASVLASLSFGLYLVRRYMPFLSNSDGSEEHIQVVWHQPQDYPQLSFRFFEEDMSMEVPTAREEALSRILGSFLSHSPVSGGVDMVLTLGPEGVVSVRFEIQNETLESFISEHQEEAWEEAVAEAGGPERWSWDPPKRRLKHAYS